MAERVVIFANGVLPASERARALLRPGDVLIGADGGTRYLLDWGLRPHEVVGDLDSLPEMTVEALRRDGVPVHRYPREKDETDLELALRHALRYQPSSICILAASGLRLDQTVANLALLTVPWLEGVDVRLDDGVEEAFFVRREGVIRGEVGDTVSLIPWGAPAEGVRTEGLRWPLEDETLYPGATRGISNELTRPVAHVRVRSGLLLVVHRRGRD
jgi:thiamine pyrophosphokinase